MGKEDIKYEVVKMGSLCHLITDGKHGDCQNEDGSGYYFISSKDVNDRKINYENARQITFDDFQDTHRRTQLEPLDILITNSGTIGRMAIVKDDKLTARTTFQKSVAILKPNKEKVLTYWFFYYLQSNKERLISYAGGTAQKNLLLRDLRAFDIELPNLKLQDKIGSILSAYDDLIENNTRRIKILEEMARLIYREWFVDYKAPGIKLRKANPDEKKVTGKDVFPDGWEVNRFGDALDVNYGKQLPTTQLKEKGKYPVYGAGSIIGYYDKYVAEDKTALITCRGNGSGTVWRTKERAFVTNNSFLVYAKTKKDLWKHHFNVFLLENSNINSIKTGSAQPQITIEGISSIKILVPSDSVVQNYCKMTTEMINYADVLDNENSNLRQTRDLLLPKLISGEVEV